MFITSFKILKWSLNESHVYKLFIYNFLIKLFIKDSMTPTLIN